MTNSPIHLDGSIGEGGGQIIRSALALSLVTGRPFTIERIRAGRKKPGLRHQHLAAVRAAAEVGRATLRGDLLGSMHLEFSPQQVRSGAYHFSVGTAGSTTLVLQTVLPALMTAEGESTVIVEGGTHNPFAPPYDFWAKTYVPLVERTGPRLECELQQWGFAPRGGGRIGLRIVPRAALAPLTLTDRGAIRKRGIRAVVANLPLHIAERECRTAAKLAGWPPKWCEAVELDDCPGTGNVVMIEVESEHVTEVFTAHGQRGVPAEQVAKTAWKEAATYLKAEVPVGTHLADQLLLPLAIGAWQGTGGGRFKTAWITPHTATHIEVIRAFLAVEPRLTPREGAVEIKLPSLPRTS